MPYKSIPLTDRLQRGLKLQPSGCWEWQGYCTRGGYGQTGSGGKYGKKLYVHRAIWEIVFGFIPERLCVLHKCDNPPCANPAHLFLGTKADNIADMVSKGRQRGPRGTQHGNAKLTWDQVHAIRVDGRTQLKIGKAYGINQTAVSAIKRGTRWK
jgi:hypothetical protein